MAAVAALPVAMTAARVAPVVAPVVATTATRATPMVANAAATTPAAPGTSTALSSVLKGTAKDNLASTLTPKDLGNLLNNKPGEPDESSKSGKSGEPDESDKPGKSDKSDKHGKSEESEESGKHGKSEESGESGENTTSSKNKGEGFFSKLKNSFGNSNGADPRTNNFTPSSGSGTVADGSIKEFNIDVMLLKPSETIMKMIYLIIFMMCIFIAFLTLYNLILFIFIALVQFIKSIINSNIILKDTLKYKILDYVDYVLYSTQNFFTGKTSVVDSPNNNAVNDAINTIGVEASSTDVTGTTKSATETTNEGQNTTGEATAGKIYEEPYFKIFTINSSISFILACFVTILLIFIVVLIIYMLLRLVPFIFFKITITENKGSSNGNTFFNFDPYGLIFISVNFVIYYIFFIQLFFNEVHKNKNIITQVDILIKERIKFYGENINVKFINEISKGEFNSDEINSFISEDILAGNFNNAKQKLLILTLYSYLYEMLRNNDRVHNLIIRYFIKDEKNPSTDDNSFVSLLIDNNYGTIKNIFYNMQFYKDFGDNINVDKIVSDVSDDVDNINSIILNVPNMDTSVYYLLQFFIIHTIINIFLIFIFICSVAYNVTKKYDSSIIFMSRFMMNIFIKFPLFASLHEIFTKTLGVKYNPNSHTFDNETDDGNKEDVENDLTTTDVDQNQKGGRKHKRRHNML